MISFETSEAPMFSSRGIFRGMKNLTQTGNKKRDPDFEYRGKNE